MYAGHATGTANEIGWLAPNYTAPISMEALFWCLETVDYRSICGMTSSATGDGGSWDKVMYVRNGAVGAYVFDGGAKQTEGGSISADTLVHAVFTLDGTTLRVYVNGVEVNNTACGASYSYPSGPYMCAGALRDPTSTIAYPSGALLLINYANVCWTPAEVRARANNPFSFLAWPGDMVMGELALVQSLAKARLVRWR